MTGYLSTIWQYRFFWGNLVRMDLRTRYRRSVLGIGWSLLQPLAMSIVMCVAFSQILNLKAEIYIPHLVTGFLCWNFIVACANSGCQCFFHAESYIRQCPLPLAVYPLRTTLGALFHFSMALVVVNVIAAYLVGTAPVNAIMSLIPTIALMFLFGWSLAVIFGLSNVYFQDTQHLTEVGFQILFYLTPIIYRAEDLKDHPFAWVFHLNPVVAFLNLVRTPLLRHDVPLWVEYGQAAGITAVAVAVASALLARLQKRLIFHL